MPLPIIFLIQFNSSIVVDAMETQGDGYSLAVTWGQRKRFADGKVRLIYKMSLEGTAGTTIAKYLSDNNIPSPAGKKVWSESTIGSILHNEKYRGDAILQKSFTVDFLTKKKKVNEVEVPQYYVQNSHPAIISAEVFDLAQAEFERRRSDRGLRRGNSCFYRK